ncbi:hypothetical protein GCK72_008538 [Caenorhabditis remanei]|uniref:F-box domain-containing protein n=1 Tax=Caenorhabditis remanei TaxID=31234 RepID=A0A6A5GZZ5_CAERE|nr:hypothetical protein GCK72_008538 [Caenorhabditis remanei]KAF1760291.1 hypothetical protein GCK72_008538 [Caenorhabditis remanei]
MEPTFPLFRLPENAILQVLQNMDPNQLLIISIVSNKTKHFVTSLVLRISNVEICISDMIILKVHIETFLLALIFYANSNDQNELLSVDITLPVSAYLPFENTRIQSSSQFNFSDWMNHIKTVFCFSKPPSVYFREGCERFEVQSLKTAIGNVDALSVPSQVTDAYSTEILKCFNTPNNLILERNPFEETHQIQQILIQNFKMFEFSSVCSLDDMLLFNSEKVRFTHPISQKQFNRFIKHWIRGSNIRLQYMALSIDKTGSVNREEYLNGIKWMGTNLDAKKEVRRKHRIDSDYVVQIKRKDGTSAVIVIESLQNVLYVRFIVLY